MTENAEIKRGRLERDDCASEINNTARDDYKNDTAHARDIENIPHVLNSIQREQVQVPNRERDKFNNNYKEITKDITLFLKFACTSRNIIVFQQSHSTAHLQLASFYPFFFCLNFISLWAC